MLLVAKLDRLARNVAFLATLIESRVRFQAVDLPAADEFTLHIMAAVAQKEASAISTRTRGAQLGSPANLTHAAREKSWVSMTQNAQGNLNNRQAAQLVTLLRATGATLRTIAEQLNQVGYRTRQGNTFHPMGIKRFLTFQAR